VHFFQHENIIYIVKENKTIKTKVCAYSPSSITTNSGTETTASWQPVEHTPVPPVVVEVEQPKPEVEVD
jgi:hypothetical protein